LELSGMVFIGGGLLLRRFSFYWHLAVASAETIGFNRHGRDFVGFVDGAFLGGGRLAHPGIR